MAPSPQEFVEIRDAKAFKVDRLPVERVPVGEYYKPCMAKLPNGQLRLVAFRQVELGEGQIREDIHLFRSSDGGKTWDDGRVLGDLLGREPYLTALSDGTLLMTVHLLQQDVRNEAGYTESYVHRSEDGGRSWTSVRCEPDDMPPKSMCCTSRNLLELHDGSVIVITSGHKGECVDFVWRSTDGGETWPEKDPVRAPVPEGYPYPFFGEAVLWQARSGDLYALNRIDPRYFPPLQAGPIETGGHDQFDRMVACRSADRGRTWAQVRDFGDYGEMYPAVLRLGDSRLLLTFTVRDYRRPLGLRAILGTEAEDRFHFDFGHDRIMLDTKTPDDRPSGGGFGNTIQLDDDTLVSCYSFRDANDLIHTEVVRWSLPQEENET